MALHHDARVLELTALEQAAALRRRDFSSEELTRLYLGRIAWLNPSLQAFVTVQGKAALRAARRADERLRRGGELPPFWGVPIGVKDLNLVRGAPVRFGSRALRYVWSPVDDRSVASLRRGGFVLLGKLATSELGALPVTEPEIHPPSRNPWDPGHTSGGSSGGSGAAVAAGLLPIAHGSDGAGSIRIPAAFCHLYGFKASRGAIANAYRLEDDLVLYTCGPLARSVDDAAAMLDVLSHGQYGAESQRPPRALRVRYSLSSSLAPTDPQIAQAVLAAVRVLETLGHHVEEAPMIEGTLDEFLPVWQRLVAQMPILRWSLVQPTTRWLGEPGRKLRAADVRAVQLGLMERGRAWFGDTDLWVTPTVPCAAPPVGAWRHLPPAEQFAAAAALGVFTAPFNLSGQPAASLPLGLTHKGLPMAVQLAGRLGADAEVLAVSRQLEEALPFRQRRAPGYFTC